jgi:predicted RNase H-like HicB family nuclease
VVAGDAQAAHGRDGIRLVDVDLKGRGRRYLIERALAPGEAAALAADCLAEAAELGDCPMRTSRVARALEARWGWPARAIRFVNGRVVALHHRLRDGGAGWIMARVVEVPGALSQGRTREEAHANVLDALRWMLNPEPDEPSGEDRDSVPLTIDASSAATWSATCAHGARVLDEVKHTRWA